MTRSLKLAMHRLRIWAFVSSCFAAVLTAGFWIASFFAQEPFAVTINSAEDDPFIGCMIAIPTGTRVGFGLKPGYLDVEFFSGAMQQTGNGEFVFVPLPGDANESLRFEHPSKAELIRQLVSNGEISPEELELLWPAENMHLLTARADFRVLSGPNRTTWHSEFTSPLQFLKDRWSQRCYYSDKESTILFVEIPFSLLFLLFAYWPALRVLKMIRGKPDEETMLELSPGEA